MSAIFVLNGQFWVGTAEEFREFIKETQSSDRATERALFILKTDGQETVEHLAEKSRITFQEAERILNFLTRLGFCREIRAS